ncbi:hypothetical protein CEW46_21140 [Bacillus cereus]|nr:hypothetical protein CEW46_21140 [Bacillus cereus]
MNSSVQQFKVNDKVRLLKPLEIGNIKVTPFHQFKIVDIGNHLGVNRAYLEPTNKELCEFLLESGLDNPVILISVDPADIEFYVPIKLIEPYNTKPKQK